jgi:hypothetical protein
VAQQAIEKRSRDVVFAHTIDPRKANIAQAQWVMGSTKGKKGITPKM